MIDGSEYMPMFLAETREHLERLNLAIVRLEQNPQDRPTVDEIFRIAHSLKGMSATMGFARVAELTHEMEDVFELLRQRAGGLTPEAIDTVFACLDALSAAVEAIEERGEEELDPKPLVRRLRSLVRARTPEQQLARNGGIDEPDLRAARAAGKRVLHVEAELAEDAPMPGVRAHMALAALAEIGELLGSVPSRQAVELFQGRRLEAWVVCEQGEERVHEAVQAISEVVAVRVGEAREPQPQRSAADDAQMPTEHTSRVRTVRVDAQRLDALMHAMGELVIHRTAVEALTAELKLPELQRAVQELTHSSQTLQAMVSRVRMIPIDIVLLRFPRLVRDLSRRLGKDVKLRLSGGETELDRTVVDALGDPLVHLVRNALDHGIEPPEERSARGKPPAATLQIAARHAGGSVIIEVSDDGRGVDPAAVARQALARGLIDERTAAELDMRAAIELLFAPGFSTAATTSEISGRGVGLDAVRAKIRAFGGEVAIDSELGEGTHAQIRLPLTLAIVSALQVEVAGSPYAIPIDRVERTLRLTAQRVRSLAARPVVVLEDGVLPLLDARRLFGHARSGEPEFVVIVRAQDRRLALGVDELVGQRELVTRPLPAIVSEQQPVSGGAALADGRIAMIVDCDALRDDAARERPISALVAA